MHWLSDNWKRVGEDKENCEKENVPVQKKQKKKTTAESGQKKKRWKRWKKGCPTVCPQLRSLG